MSIGPLRDIDDDCSVCGRVIAEHTVNEWNTCLATKTTDLDFEYLPTDARALAERFGLPPGSVVADNVIVKATGMQAQIAGGGEVALPVVLQEFSLSPDVGKPVATVMLMFADRAGAEGYVALMNDTVVAAVRAAGA